MDVDEHARELLPDVATLFDSVPIPAYVFQYRDEDFVMIAANRAARDVSPALPSLLGQPIMPFFDSQPWLKTDALRCHHEQKTITRETSYRRITAAEQRDLHITYSPLPNDRVLVFTQDLTPTRRTEAALVEATGALRHSREHLSLALQAARMGTWEFDLTQNRGWWSEDFHALYVREDTPKDFTGFLSMVHPDDREKIANVAIALMQSKGAKPIEVEFRIVRPDGDVRWVHTSGRLVEADGTRLIGTIMDVSERRRLEDEIVQTQKLDSIGRLAGGVAHDFNNLLTAILGAVTGAEHIAPPELAEDLQTVRLAAERASDLTRQLLAFARKQVVHVRPIDLNALVVEAERMLVRIVGEDVVIATQLDPKLGLVMADPGELERVIVNLAANARDAMRHGGRLTIETRNVERVIMTANGAAPGERADQPMPFVELTVADTGVGMDASTRRNLFEPFYTTKRSGTGLGLASSYGIIKQLNGEIEVDSTPGAGARFRIFLPRAQGAGLLASIVSPLATTRGNGEMVLLAEDDDLLRRITERSLTRLGYAVMTAADSEEALALSTHHPGVIDLLVTDVMMPKENGVQLAARIRQTRPEIRVLFVSGYARNSLRADQPYLQKPFTEEALAAKVSELLRSAAVNL